MENNVIIEIKDLEEELKAIIEENARCKSSIEVAELAKKQLIKNKKRMNEIMKVLLEV